MINGNACFAYFNKNWGIPPNMQRLLWGHFRPGRGQQTSRHVRDAAESDSKFTVLAATP